VLTITADNTDTRFVIRLSGETLPPIALGDYMLPETEQIPGTEYQATVSVANRHTDENVTTQLLFIDEQQTATIIAKAERVMARNTTETFTLTGNTPLAEGTYQVYIKVTAAGITLETARHSVTLKHIRAMEVTDSAGIAVSSGHKVDFGTVADSVSKSFIITNTGTADMTVSSLTAPDGFTVTPALADGSVVLAAGEKMKLLITMNTALASGELAGNVVIGYSLDGSTDCSFLLSVSGTALNPEKVGVMLDNMAERNAGRPVYNLRGERTTQLRKGHVYIQNGKTFIHR
jgi:phage-related tail fiber protein